MGRGRVENRYGLTFTEWLYASRHRKRTDVLRAAWERGEDPSEWIGAKTAAPNRAGRRRRARRARPVCRCRAYSFPHARGGGACRE